MLTVMLEEFETEPSNYKTGHQHNEGTWQQ